MPVFALPGGCSVCRPSQPRQAKLMKPALARKSKHTLGSKSTRVAPR